MSREEQLEAALKALIEAADPFVRATALQAPLKLPDDLGIARAFPGLWPNMGDARALTKASKLAQKVMGLSALSPKEGKE